MCLICLVCTDGKKSGHKRYDFHEHLCTDHSKLSPPKVGSVSWNVESGLTSTQTVRVIIRYARPALGSRRLSLGRISNENGRQRSCCDTNLAGGKLRILLDHVAIDK